MTLPNDYQTVKGALQKLNAKRIIVTGPQRSGTRIAATCLAHDLSLRFVGEEEFRSRSLLLMASKLFAAPCVMQAPALSAQVHVVSACIVFMRRPLDEIQASQERIQWHGEPFERRQYRSPLFQGFRFTDNEPIAAVKYRAWETLQRRHVEHAFDLDYHSLRGHSLWVEKGERQEFAPLQTTTKQRSGPVKLELGGGGNPKPGFINVDNTTTADCRLDLESLGDGVTLPYEDNSVTELYSSHCLEHIRNLPGVMRELIRVCAVGARVEIRVPHWLNEMALCFDHKHTISPDQVHHWTEAFPDHWFGGSGKKLYLLGTDYVKSRHFDWWRTKFPPCQFSDLDLMKFFPGACHEIVYVMSVVPFSAPAGRRPGT